MSRAWDTAWLMGLAAAIVGAARVDIGLTIHVGFLPLFVAPVLAAYLPRFSILDFVLISLAATLPVLDISRIGDWIQITLLTLSATGLVGAVVVPLAGDAFPGGWPFLSLPLRGRPGGGGERKKGFDGLETVPTPTQPPPEGEGEGEGHDQRPPHTLRRTLVLVAWCLWLTWPIWLANAWPNPSIAPWLDRLLPFNPLAAIGGVLIDLGDWTHMPIAYTHLLNLGQDVPYEPPTSAWAAIIAHGLLASAVWLTRRTLRGFCAGRRIAS